MVFVNCLEAPCFRIADPPYVDENKKLVTYPLLEEKEWKIDKKFYDEYEALVYKYLTPTLIPSRNKN